MKKCCQEAYIKGLNKGLEVEKTQTKARVTYYQELAIELGLIRNANK